MSIAFLLLLHYMERSIKIIFSFLIIFFLIGGEGLMAQGVVNSDYFENDSISQPFEQMEQFELFVPKVKLQLGSSFSTFGSGYSGFSSYVAPEVSMPVSKKLTMSFGMGYSSMFFNTPLESTIQSNSTSYGNLFVSGSYQVNEKLVISGTAYKTFLLNTSPESKSLNSQFYDFSNQGVLFGAEYKVNENFRIGVSVEYREQNHPSFYQGNSLYQGNSNLMSSPFRPTMFGPSY